MFKRLIRLEIKDVLLDLIWVIFSALGANLITFASVNITNNVRDIDDSITAQVVSASTGLPVTGVVVNVMLYMPKDPGEYTFYDPAIENFEGYLVDSADGKFTLRLPKRDKNTNEIAQSLYLVAFDAINNQPVGYMILNSNSGLFREGPSLSNSIFDNDITLKEYGAGKQDTIKVNRIYPAGAPGAGSYQTLPDNALPYVFYIVDSNDDENIDVLGSDIEIVAIQPLLLNTGIPFPGTQATEIGDNHWIADSQTFTGRSHIFVALMDA